MHWQMLALDDTRHLLGVGRAVEPAQGDVRIERFAGRIRVELVV